ncbi:MAG TPA: ABC transporter permease subunit [Deltaproteobacteria bacterium]|nr:ABC transporter permease subunit [Deltaproteobacteria bacterium]
MPRLRDRHVRWALTPIAIGALAWPVAITAMIAVRSSTALAQVGLLAFVLDPEWAPSRSRWLISQLAATTVVSSLAAIGLAAPVSLGLALHLRWFAGPIPAGGVRLVLGVLAGVPSVVYGLVALTVWVPLVRAVQPPGLSLLAASITLAIMITPTLALGADAALQGVEAGPVRAAAALGLGPVDTTRAVLLPLAAPGLRVAVVVAITRALGETMALLMVAGNAVSWPSSPFVPVRTLTGGIAVEMAYATGVHRSALFVCGLLLLLLVSLLALGGRR